MLRSLFLCDLRMPDAISNPSIVHPSWVATPMVFNEFSAESVKGFLSVQQVAKAVVDQVESGQSGACYLPWGIRFTPLLRALPHSWQNNIRLGIAGQLTQLMTEDQRQRILGPTVAFLNE